MKTLGQVNAAWAGDRGEPDADVRAALAASGAGDPDAYLAAVAALCGARLLLPIVADGDEFGAGPDPDHGEPAPGGEPADRTGGVGALALGHQQVRTAQ